MLLVFQANTQASFSRQIRTGHAESYKSSSLVRILLKVNAKTRLSDKMKVSKLAKSLLKEQENFN